MKINIYAINDAQVSAFSQPFFSQTNGAALRAFSDHVNEKGTQPNKHPQDYSLWHLGTFNDDDGTIEPVKPSRIGTAVEYHNKE